MNKSHTENSEQLTTQDSKSKHPKLTPPEAYANRDVLGLKAATEWTKAEKKSHMQHNRILQPGFMDRSPEAFVADAKIARVEWLTDYCCPSIKASLMLNISAEMVVRYQVTEKELNKKAQEVFSNLLKQNPNIEKEIQ